MQLSQLFEQIENQLGLPRFLSGIAASFERSFPQSEQSRQQPWRQVEEKEVPGAGKRHTAGKAKLCYEQAGSRPPKIVKE